MSETDGNSFSITVRGGNGEELFSSDDITSLEFDLSENELLASLDSSVGDEPVFVTDGDTDEG